MKRIGIKTITHSIIVNGLYGASGVGTEGTVYVLSSGLRTKSTTKSQAVMMIICMLKNAPVVAVELAIEMVPNYVGLMDAIAFAGIQLSHEYHSCDNNHILLSQL